MVARSQYAPSPSVEFASLILQKTKVAGEQTCPAPPRARSSMDERACWNRRRSEEVRTVSSLLWYTTPTTTTTTTADAFALRKSHSAPAGRCPRNTSSCPTVCSPRVLYGIFHQGPVQALRDERPIREQVLVAAELLPARPIGESVSKHTHAKK